MSTSFFPHYVSFKINGVTILSDDPTIHDNQNTKWVRFRGTPCTKGASGIVVSHITLTQ